MMGDWRRRLAVVVALCAAVSCSDGDPPAPPVSFSGPGDVAFVCFDLSDPNSARSVPLSECPNPLDDPGNDRVLHALVTQTSTGELAAVEMRRTRTSIGTQPGRVVDSRTDIPGFTFVDVGATPTNVVVPKDHPEFTYVSSFWSQTIGTFRTDALRPVGAAPPDPRVGEPLQLGARPAEMVIDPRGTHLYVAAPDAGAVLRIEICRDASACEVGTLLPPETIPLAVADAVLNLPAAMGSDAREPYTSDGECASCSDGACVDYAYASAPTLPPPVLPAAQAEDPDAGPRPTSLAIDISCRDATIATAVGATGSDAGLADAGLADAGLADGGLTDGGLTDGGLADGGAATTEVGDAGTDAGMANAGAQADADCVPVLLVGDENLPVIHRVSMADAPQLLAPLETRVPVTDVVATPAVPVDLAGTAQTSYVYAIDATDGSVMVLQDGQILTVSDEPLQRRDRLSVNGAIAGARALSLEVVTPGVEGLPFETATPVTDPSRLMCALTDTEADNPDLVTSQPARLRGVYLVAGGSDGRLRVYDVHDLDLQAYADGLRPGDGSDFSLAGCTRDCPYFVRRHRPRVLTNIISPPRAVSIVAEGEVQETLSVGTVVQTLAYGTDNETLSIRLDGTSRDDRLPALSCIPCRDLDMSEGFPGEIPDTVVVNDDDPVTGETTDELVLVPVLPPVEVEDEDAGVGAGEPMPDADDSDDTDDDDAEPARCEQGGRVCTVGDPWVANEDRWTLALEGVVPGARGFRGRLVEGDTTGLADGEVRWAVATSMCEAGVLAGDQLVISSLPDERIRDELNEECRAFVELLQDPEDRRFLGFEILSASDRELIVSDDPVRSVDGLPSRLSELVECFRAPGLGGESLDATPAIGYEVRTLNSFLVTGLRTGYLHSVQEVDGECTDTATLSSGLSRNPRAPICDPVGSDADDDGEVEEAAGEGGSPAQTAAVDDGCIFNNGYIAVRMELENLDGLLWESRSLLVIDLFPTASHLIFDAQQVSAAQAGGVLPVRMRYSGSDLRLYMIDPQVRGLLPIRVDRFPTALTSSAAHLN